jgi:uncharacterized protein YihD (DUF1040 family)
MSPGISDLMARASAALRVIPLDNPKWGSDALLKLADVLEEDARELGLHDGPLGRATRQVLINDMRLLAARAQAEAPRHAGPRPLAQRPDLLPREGAR